MIYIDKLHLSFCDSHKCHFCHSPLCSKEIHPPRAWSCIRFSKCIKRIILYLMETPYLCAGFETTHATIANVKRDDSLRGTPYMNGDTQRRIPIPKRKIDLLIKRTPRSDDFDTLRRKPPDCAVKGLLFCSSMVFTYLTRIFLTVPSVMRMMLMPFSALGSLRPSRE